MRAVPFIGNRCGLMWRKPHEPLARVRTHERPCDNPKFACDGKIDKARLYTNADFKKAAEDGVEWWEIKWEIEEEFPEMAEIYQSALNCAQHVGQGNCRDTRSSTIVF